MSLRSLLVCVSVFLGTASPVTAQIGRPPDPVRADAAAPGWLGVMLADAETPQGATVRRTVPGSAAAASPLIAGDVIVAVDGAPTATADAVVERVRGRSVGEMILLTTFRDGESLDVAITLGPRPADTRLLARQYVGEPFPPDLSAVDVVSDATIPLAPVDGRVHLVEFWATWCGPCERAMPHIETLRAATNDAEVSIVAVTSENDRDAIRGWHDAHRPSYAVALDADGAAAAALFVDMLPTYFVVDANGIIRGVYAGLEGVTAAVDHVEALASP